ncbi:Methuselah N-terminus [Popillia japonica]|uniref:Methuselah N-terminus n=1 Tax=Popillia japonica TaxID=7064 RepID=A0AAW1M185_POPJA
MKFYYVLLFSVSFTIIQTCTCCPVNNLNETIDITNGTRNGDIIIYNGIYFTIDDYFHFQNKTYGCICDIKVCLPKCCGEGNRWVNNRCQKDTSIPRIPIHRGTEVLDLEENNFYLIKMGTTCDGQLTVLPGMIKSYIQENGHLHTTAGNYTNKTSYCIEGTDALDLVIIVCVPAISPSNAPQDMASSSGMSSD